MTIKCNNILIVSPHCDDACFSLGGSILKNSDKNITVWDVFNIKNYTILSESLEDTKQRIIDEEKNFIKKSNISVVFGELPEAYLRGYKRLSNILCSNILDIERNIKEKEVYNKIVQEFVQIYNQIRPECIGLPLGCGGHIDHLIVREAGLSWWSSLVQEERPELFLYEELPYALNKTWTSKVFDEISHKGLIITPYNIIIEDHIDEKLEMVKKYKSQIKERDSKLLVSYAFKINSENPSERIWIISKKRRN